MEFGDKKFNRKDFKNDITLIINNHLLDCDTIFKGGSCGNLSKAGINGTKTMRVKLLIHNHITEYNGKTTVSVVKDMLAMLDKHLLEKYKFTVTAKSVNKQQRNNFATVTLHISDESLTIHNENEYFRFIQNNIGDYGGKTVKLGRTEYIMPSQVYPNADTMELSVQMISVNQHMRATISVQRLYEKSPEVRQGYYVWQEINKL